MIERVIKFIREKEMLLPDDNIIVGVSGGADSVCLLHMLMKVSRIIPVKLYVVHIEHGIRGEESIKDAEYVEELCKIYNLPFKLYSYDVIKEAEKNRLGTEEMGRILRYRAFEAFAEQLREELFKDYPKKDINAEKAVRIKIAVAHNKNDTVETTLLNLFRGSGLKGLTGIPPVRGNIIRPLLCLERFEIEQWLKTENIQYKDDASNFEEDYTRNKIRLKVLPYVRDNINSKAVANIDNAARFLTQANSYIEEQSKSAYLRCADESDKKISIRLDEFDREADIIKRNIIIECIRNVNGGLKDIGNVHIEAVLFLAANSTGKSVNLPYGITARRSYRTIDIYIEKNEDNIIGIETKTKDTIKEVIDISVPGICIYGGYEFEFSLEKNEKDKIIPEKMYTKWFDYDKIIDTLRLRTRETGDYIEVNSLGQTKKLKSYFINQKIEQNLRDKIALLCDNKHVIWIVGYRISERYKVTDKTENILKVHVLNGGKNNGR